MLTDMVDAVPDPPRRRVGDRLEEAIEHRADVPAELARGEQELEREPARSGALRRTIFWLAVSGVSLYLVAPSIIAALGSWRQIERLSPAQLAANALAKMAPGGGAMGSALQYRMLVDTGVKRPAAVSGLTASTLLLFGIV